MNFKNLDFDHWRQLERQIEMTMADLGYEPPSVGDTGETWRTKILIAFVDLQRRVNT
jgi:hypothetical protein